MICEVTANVRDLSLQDVMRLFEKAVRHHVPFPKLDIRDFLELACRLGYRYEEWQGKLDLTMTIYEFNAFVNILEQHNVEILYSRYGNFLDCLTFRIGRDLATICEDPELGREEKRITFLDLESLSRYVKISFRIVTYRGEHLSAYVKDVPVYSTFTTMPVYYVLQVSKLSIQDLLSGVFASLVLARDEVNDDAVALGILMTRRDVSGLGYAHYFVSISDLQRACQCVDDVILQEDDRKVSLVIEKRRILTGVRVDKSMLRILYMDVIGLLQHGIEPWMVKLCVA